MLSLWFFNSGLVVPIRCPRLNLLIIKFGHRLSKLWLAFAFFHSINIASLILDDRFSSGAIFNYERSLVFIEVSIAANYLWFFVIFNSYSILFLYMWENGIPQELPGGGIFINIGIVFEKIKRIYFLIFHILKEIQISHRSPLQNICCILWVFSFLCDEEIESQSR